MDDRLAGLDHIANFINALDSSDMSAKDVRSAIYSECLAPTPPATQDSGDLVEARIRVLFHDIKLDLRHLTDYGEGAAAYEHVKQLEELFSALQSRADE